MFFAVAFGFSWVFWGPQALAAQGFFNPPPVLSDFLFSPFNPAAFGPFVAALLLSFLNGGKTGVKSLLRKGVELGFPKKWFAAVFLTHPLIVGASLVLAVLSGDPLPDFAALSNPVFLLVMFVFIFFLGGPFQEEWGWRGYALERFQVRWSALVSSLLLGLVWGIWHTPLFFIPGTIQSQTPVWGFFILIVSGSVLFTWIYNNTNNSIFAAMLFHTMNNFTLVVIPALQTTFGGLFLLVLSAAAAIFVAVVWGPRNLRKIAA